MPDGLKPDRDFDELLDSALSTYADPGPESGLEDRILARITASAVVARANAPRRWLVWAFAIPAAACLLVALILPGVKTMHAPAGRVSSGQVSSGPASSRQVAPVPAQPSPVTARSFESPALPSARSMREPRGPADQAALRPAPRPSRLPKLDVFPAPQPLSPEEEILARFATQASPAERALFLDAQRQAETPLPIAAIHIPPLDPPVKGDN